MARKRSDTDRFMRIIHPKCCQKRPDSRRTSPLTFRGVLVESRRIDFRGIKRVNPTQSRCETGKCTSVPPQVIRGSE